MKRRHLLQLMGLGSLTSICPLSWSAIGDGVKSDKLWLVVYANAGWDPVSFANPNSGDYIMGNNQNRGRISGYDQSFIKKIGDIEYAPAITPTSDPAYGRFVEKYYQSLLVINGVEMGTNGHQEGQTKAISGVFGRTFPSFAAYAAAAAGPDSGTPLPFLAGGAYSNTGNLISRVDINGVRLAADLSETSNHLGTTAVHSPDIAQMLKEAQLDHIKEIADDHLPRLTQELNDFYDTKLSSSTLKKLKDKLPTTYNQDQTLARFQDVFAAMAAGLTVSAQIPIGRSFDTHGNHDVAQGNSVNYLFNSMDFVLQEASRQGISDRLNIIMLSDFGRTPFYNGNNGKDHWSTSSMLFMGPDFTGNRMIKATDKLVRPVKVNLKTLMPDEKGELITPEIINRSLRNLTGTLNSSMDQAFALNAPAAPALFTG
jgi:hypothetical protein